MQPLPTASPRNNCIKHIIFFMISFMCSIPGKTIVCTNDNSPSAGFVKEASSGIPSFEKLSLDGYLRFDDLDHAAKDFGNIHHSLPKAVLHPKSADDIASMIKHINEMGSSKTLSVAARGNGHSLHGQAQASQGIVIHMQSLKDRGMEIYRGEKPFVDVSGGELWINVLRETLKSGLAPKSWTDYLHLTVGGTLSNAGISGQAFRHGPQINNVNRLEVITGKGDIVICSEDQNAELFHSVLGGLGQFGIITRARISLEIAPTTVKWIRVLYSDFEQFSKDQEFLITSMRSFDYIEGFVFINIPGILSNWRSSFAPREPLHASKFISEGRTLYCLEIAKYFYLEDFDDYNQKIEIMLSKLSFIPSTLFMKEVSYIGFLDRVHASSKKLKSKGLWDVPHPWLNLFVPKSSMHKFASEVFGSILTDSKNGPILVYPVDKSSWNNKTSLVTPEENIFYVVAILPSVVPSSTGNDSLEYIQSQNKRILSLCSTANLGVKQYLPHYHSKQEWQAHFGSRWEIFKQRKLKYDPLAILAPGQRIFRRQ